jgi:FtsP/CotA-like multicopper oxidase with cupredoxin domain
MVELATNNLGGERLQHRSYNGMLTGPEIYVDPGSVLEVHLVNNLSPEPDTAPYPDQNEPHGFNTTNLHTHGLHVSPESPADNVFLQIEPGCDYSFRFEFD